MKASARLLGATLLVAAAFGAHSAAVDPQAGARIYDGLCARCHGFDGFGATGPNLQRSEVTRPGNEAALQAIVLNGIPTRGMPPATLSEAEMQALIAHVHRLRGADAAAWSASAQRGKAIYERLDCSSCHVLAGQGRSAGPELTRIGIKRKPEQLREDLTAPAASLPRAGAMTEYLPVRVLTRKGRSIAGMRINEDAFTVQLRDEQGRLHSLRKSELTQIDKQFDRSTMPSYELNDAELTDLVAYLSSLRGAP